MSSFLLLLLLLLFRCYGGIPGEGQVTYSQCYCPAIHILQEHVDSGMIFIRSIFENMDATNAPVNMVEFHKFRNTVHNLKRQLNAYYETVQVRGELRIETVITTTVLEQVLRNYIDLADAPQQVIKEQQKNEKK